jgi:hypothetical protein
LKNKLKGQCPCGYVFDISDEKTAITEVRLHFERFHTDFLPFGITNDEALALLNKGKEQRKQKLSKNFSHSSKIQLAQ